MSEISPTDRFNRIAECGLCIGCGLCQSIAGIEQIKMKITDQGYERPVVVGKLSAELVDRIYDTCPGTRVEGLPASEYDDHTQFDPVWGEYQSIVRAYASDPGVRFRGSTGGVLTALGLFLIESKKVDFILHARASESQPTFGEAHISRTPGEVLEGAGSRYGPTATLADVCSALDLGQPFAFVGTPCDIGALRNYARHDERVDKLVKYWMTPVCGGFSPPPATQRFLDSVGVAAKELKSLRYRGFGCPGPTRVETRDGRVVEKITSICGVRTKPSGHCRFAVKCVRTVSATPPISPRQTLGRGSPEREGQEKDPGVNAVIARTSRGKALIEQAEAEGYLTVESVIGVDEMSLYQPHQVNKKYAVWGRYQGLRAAGLIAPDTERLRIEELASSMDDEFNRLQSEGTQRRVQEGKVREPTPS